jgi:hypothetical protein
MAVQRIDRTMVRRLDTDPPLRVCGLRREDVQLTLLKRLTEPALCQPPRGIPRGQPLRGLRVSTANRRRRRGLVTAVAAQATMVIVVVTDLTADLPP